MLLLGTLKAPLTPSPGLPTRGAAGAARNGAEPLGCRHTLTEGLYPTVRLLLRWTKSPTPALHPARSAPSYTRSCAKRFYIPFGIILICIPTADAIPAPKAKQVEAQRTLQLCYRYCCAHKNGQIQDKIAGSPTVSALRSAELGQALPGSIRSISRCFMQREDKRHSIQRSQWIVATTIPSTVIHNLHSCGSVLPQTRILVLSRMFHEPL